jgi:FkbM family methyltransferase
MIFYPAIGFLRDSSWQSAGVRVERIGTEYGARWVAMDLLRTGGSVYSFGIGCDISFDEEIIARTGCEVYGFDPTPKSAEWIHRHPGLPHGFTFEQSGIAESSGRRLLHLPEGDENVSGSITTRLSGMSVECDFFSLGDIMKRLGHSTVDLIKLDVEGAEYGIVAGWLDGGAQLPVNQLWVEFHPRLVGKTTAGTARLVRQMEAIGLVSAKRAFRQDPNHYLLVRKSGL